MKLTNRLLAVAVQVENGSNVADIGTDHAYIPVYLVENNISTNVIAADINEGPLERAKEHINQNHVEKYIKTRLGSGLTVLKPNEVETVIIAGMGGVLITQIFENSKDVLKTIKRLVLQPMVGQEVVREWLCINGFRIVDEVLAKEENKIYNIIVAEHGMEEIDNKIFFDIGKRLIEKKDPLLKELLNKKIEKTKIIIRKLGNEKTDRAMERKRVCEDLLSDYLEVQEQIVT